MNQIQNLISDAVVQALGWTLLHSLWQGTLLAVILCLLMLVLHRHSSKTRYTIAAGALLLQVLVSAVTFDHYYIAPAQQASTTDVAFYLQSVVTNPEAQPTFWEAPLAASKVYFSQHLPLIVMFWLMGLALMALRFLGGLAYTQRLRHYKTSPLPLKWQQTLTQLQQELGMSKVVRLAESALIKTPVAIGYAKPVILLPVGAVTGLSQAQVEAILAHELAHILRRDYLFNIIQSVVDIMFFYHPAMWWISGVVRAERENCCDDIAVAVCGNSLTYARALAELEAMRMPAGPSLAMAFSGNRGTLMSRIKRLLGQQTLRPTFTEGFVAATVLILGLTVFSYGAVASLNMPAKNTLGATLEAASIPTLVITDENEPENDGSNAYSYTIQDEDGKTRDIVIIKNKKGKVKELYVDGKRIPKKDIPKYTELIEQRLQATKNAPKATKIEIVRGMQREQKIIARAKAGDDEQVEYHFRIIHNGDSTVAAPLPPLPPLPALPPLPPQAPPADNKEAQKRYKEAMEDYKREMAKHQDGDKRIEKEIRIIREGAKVDEKRIEKHIQRQEHHMQRAEEMAKHHEGTARIHEEKAMKHESQLKVIKQELIKDGFMKQESDKIELEITEDSLVINGKKQSQEMYNKYKKLLNLNVEGKSRFKFKQNN